MANIKLRPEAIADLEKGFVLHRLVGIMTENQIKMQNNPLCAMGKQNVQKNLFKNTVFFVNSIFPCTTCERRKNVPIINSISCAFFSFKA